MAVRGLLLVLALALVVSSSVSLVLFVRLPAVVLLFGVLVHAAPLTFGVLVRLVAVVILPPVHAGPLVVVPTPHVHAPALVVVPDLLAGLCALRQAKVYQVGLAEQPRYLGFLAVAGAVVVGAALDHCMNHRPHSNDNPPV